MFMNKMGNGANLSNTVDIVANSIKLIRRINGVDVLLDITDALEGHGSIGMQGNQGNQGIPGPAGIGSGSGSGNQGIQGNPGLQGVAGI